MFLSNSWRKNKQFILYGIALALLICLLRWLQWKFIIFNNAFELYAGAIALLFTCLGIWIALKLNKPAKITSEELVTTVINDAEIIRLGLSKRELEVLTLMANGLSNIEIAERLFVSINTIKTHSSNLFVKLDVERRTQAIEKAKRLRLII
ncbi:MAG: response regulator transcription factor [Sphingobacteriales bacterium]|nr:MAG: response regulator transcription factor [Sphingobacteriales bacterium]